MALSLTDVLKVGQMVLFLSGKEDRFYGWITEITLRDGQPCSVVVSNADNGQRHVITRDDIVRIVR